MSNPESFVQHVGCFCFQSVHLSMDAAKHFGTGLKMTCTKLGLLCFSSSFADTPPWEERYIAVVSNREEGLHAGHLQELDPPPSHLAEPYH